MYKGTPIQEQIEVFLEASKAITRLGGESMARYCELYVAALKTLSDDGPLPDFRKPTDSHDLAQFDPAVSVFMCECPFFSMLEVEVPRLVMGEDRADLAEKIRRFAKADREARRLVRHALIRALPNFEIHDRSDPDNPEIIKLRAGGIVEAVIQHLSLSETRLCMSVDNLNPEGEEGLVEVIEHTSGNTYYVKRLEVA